MKKLAMLLLLTGCTHITPNDGVHKVDIYITDHAQYLCGAASCAWPAARPCMIVLDPDTWDRDLADQIENCMTNKKPVDHEG